MNILINTSELTSAITEAASFINPKSPIMVLKYAKVTTKGNRIKIEAHDTYAYIKKYLTAIEIDGEDSFLIDVVELSKYLQKINDESISLTISDNTLVVKHKRGKAQFQTINAGEYAAFESPEGDKTEFELPSDMLETAIRYGKNFVGADDLRPQMKPIYAYIKEGIFGYAATDTRILINETFPLSENTSDINFFIEPNVFGRLTSLLKNCEKVKVAVTPKNVSYQSQDTTIVTVQTKGNYPNFERVIPRDFSIEGHIESKDVTDALKRVSLFCDTNNLVKFTFSQFDLVLSAQDLGSMKESTESIPHEGCNGDIKIGFNQENFLTALASCNSDKVTMRMNDSSRPAVFVGEASPNRIILAMPMVIN